MKLNIKLIITMNRNKFTEDIITSIYAFISTIYYRLSDFDAKTCKTNSTVTMHTV